MYVNPIRGGQLRIHFLLRVIGQENFLNGQYRRRLPHTAVSADVYIKLEDNCWLGINPLNGVPLDAVPKISTGI